MGKQKKDWWFALILTMPMILFYLAYYFNHSSALIPTGFIGYDNVSYVANAKQYLDADHFSLFYSNPLNDSANYPAIYFQPQTLLLAFLLWLGIAPGFTIVFLNWLGTLLSFRMAIGIYDHLYPNSTHRKLFVSFFCWGGGLLALACIPIALVKPMGNLDFLDRIFFIDPAWGWWGLNFGRGHFISTEGVFHFLFLAGILSILKKKWNVALIASLLLSLSHPFTGIEYLSIVVAWLFVEKLFIRNKNIPWSFIIGTLLIMAFHVYYYLFYLNQFPEHRSVSEQYALNWRLRFFNMVPAYCLVGSLALISFLRLKEKIFKDISARLFLSWFIIAFLLANHEVFMKPMQPLHFTRGYVWTGLFLLGLPALHKLFENEKLKRFPVVLILFSAALLSDNFLWIVNSIRFTPTIPSTSYITAEQKKLLSIIAKNSDGRTLIIGEDEVLVYMSSVYSKAYPWISHPFTTPFAIKKEKAYQDFIEKGTIDSLWEKREAIFIFHKNKPAEIQRSQLLPFATTVLANSQSYILQKGIIP